MHDEFGTYDGGSNVSPFASFGPRSSFGPGNLSA